MILGAGIAQVPLIRKAKRMDLLTIVVSRAGDYPGFEDADVIVPIDVTDCEGVLKAAKENRIAAVLTNQTDLPVVTAAYVAESLGLPGIGISVAEKFTNKYVMRKATDRCGGKIVKCYRVRTMEQALAASDSIGFPLIIKPAANQGGRGVFQVINQDELVQAFPRTQKQARARRIVLEEYVEGPELRLDGIKLAEGFHNLPLGDALHFDIPRIFIPKIVAYPSRLPIFVKSKVLKLNSAIVQELGLPFGLTHSEFRVDQQTGEIFFIEVGARGGGTFISSDLMPLACGIDPEEVLLKQSLGLEVDLPGRLEERAAAYYAIAGLPRGVLREVRGMEAAEKIQGVHRIVSSLRVGAFLEETVDLTSRLAYFILSGESRADIEHTVGKLEETLSFAIETEDGKAVYGLKQ